MVTVCFDVEKVVDDVGSGGAETKAEERDDCGGDQSFGPGMGEEQRKEDEDVFRPLMDSNGLEPGFESGNAFVEGADRDNVCFAEGGEEAGGGIGDHWLLGMLQERKIRHGVADVGETVAETGLEGGEFVFAGEVDGAVGGQDAGKEPEVVGDAVGSVGVGGCGEVDRAASGTLLFKILKEFAVVGKVRDVELDRIGQVAFQGSFALKEPARQVQQRSGAVAGYGECRVVEGVRFHEGAIEVDAEYREAVDGSSGGRDKQKCPSLRLNL